MDALRRTSFRLIEKKWKEIPRGKCRGFTIVFQPRDSILRNERVNARVYTHTLFFLSPCFLLWSLAKALISFLFAREIPRESTISEKAGQRLQVSAGGMEVSPVSHVVARPSISVWTARLFLLLPCVHSCESSDEKDEELPSNWNR